MAVNSFNAQNPPLTTKGDLFTFSTIPTRLGIGSNNTVLTADSSTATGLKWAGVSSSKTYSLVNSGGTSLTSAATITVSGITGDDILILVGGASSANASSTISIRFNTDSASKYALMGPKLKQASTYLTSSMGHNNIAPDSATEIALAVMGGNAGSSLSGHLRVFGCKSTALKPYIGAGGADGAQDQFIYVSGGIYSATAAITSISVVSSTGNFDGGTVYVYEAQ